jgi:hypothetical protein
MLGKSQTLNLTKLNKVARLGCFITMFERVYNYFYYLETINHKKEFETMVLMPKKSLLGVCIT